MKYTKKQLESAYEQWTTECRLNPSLFMSVKDTSEVDVNEYSKLCIKELLSHVK